MITQNEHGDFVHDYELSEKEYWKDVIDHITRAEDRAIYHWSVLEGFRKEPDFDAVPQDLRDINDDMRERHGFAPRWR